MPQRKRTLIERVCPVCGKKYLAHPQRLQHGRQTTCSRPCSYQSRQEKRKLRETRNCLACGKSFELSVSRLKEITKGIGKYCSRACRDNHRHGKNHPQYMNGAASNKSGARGPNWQKQRRATKRRDKNVCQHCGKTGKGLNVHHIKPFRLFPSYLEANVLSNLITLCGTCHRIAEAELQRDENGTN